MKLKLTTQLMLYVSQLFQSFRKNTETQLTQAAPPKYKDYLHLRLPSTTSSGILVLPENFDYSQLSVHTSIQVQSLEQENRVIIVNGLHSPAVIQ